MAGDHELENLARALADGQDFGVAVEAWDVRLFHVAVAAVDLHGDVGGMHGQLTREQLGLRSLLRIRLARVLERGSAVHHRPRRADASLQVSEREGHRLEARDWLAERTTLLRPIYGMIQTALGEAHAHGRDADPTAVQGLQELARARAARTDQPIFSYGRWGKKPSVCVGTMSVETSGLPASRWPVMAVVITKELMSVPALV